jgi:hypothetical protein
MSVRRRSAVKAWTISALIVASAPAMAGEFVDSKSPDGNFALRVSRENQQPYRQNTAIVDSKTSKPVLNLDLNQVFDPEAKLVWSSDSQWVAYLSKIDEETESSATRVFVRNGSSFDEIKLPELPSPKIPGRAPSSEKRSTWIKPVHWSKPGSLDLEYEIITESGWRGATKLAVQFDRQQPASIVKAEPETMSIVDYYLLLPKDTFETPPRAWLGNAQVFDKQNGYISITGDGAQPSFQVALFRYRDGRPLLALCFGELEGDDSVALDFFELGADGKMHKASRSVFPIGDRWSSGEYESKYEDFQFDLPRHGRTILVRSHKSGKVLRKLTWNGEKFVEQRDAASN